MRTLVPLDQVPQLKIGKTISFNGQQTQMICQFSPALRNPFILGVRLSVFYSWLLRLPKLLLMVLSSFHFIRLLLHATPPPTYGTKSSPLSLLPKSYLITLKPARDEKTCLISASHNTTYYGKTRYHSMSNTIAE